MKRGECGPCLHHLGTLAEGSVFGSDPLRTGPTLANNPWLFLFLNTKQL